MAALDNGEGTIEPGGVVLNWQENSQTANVFMQGNASSYTTCSIKITVT